MVDVVVLRNTPGNNEESSLPAGFQSEPNLLRDSKHVLPQFFDTGCQQHSPEHLAKRIARNPRDLRVHTQRVLAFHQRQRAEPCYASLVDLFAVLGERGIELRRNLLHKCRDTITLGQYDFLSSHIEKGLLDKDILTNMPIGSRLHNGAGGTQEIVKLKNARPAQAQLEARVLNDPGDEDACRNLLVLYRENGDSASFVRIFSTLMGRRIAVPELWRETEANLKKYG